MRTNFQKITSAEFDKLFEIANDKIFKLEILAEYSSDKESSAYKLFKENKLEELKNLFRDEFSKDTFNARFIRVHLYNEPMNEYLKFELIAYEVWKEFGIEIYLKKFKDINTDNSILEDFILFDNFAVVVNNFGENNELIDSIVSYDKAEVNKYLALSNLIYSQVK